MDISEEIKRLLIVQVSFILKVHMQNCKIQAWSCSN